MHFFARGMEDFAPSNLPTGLWGGANYPGVVNVAINAPGKNVVGNLTWTISPKMVNEVEFAYSQGTISGALSGQANSASVLRSLTNKLAYPDPYGRIPSVAILDSSVTVVSQGSAPYFERNLDRNIFDNFTDVGQSHPAHGLHRAADAEDRGRLGGNPNFNFNTWGDFLLGNARTITGQPRYRSRSALLEHGSLCPGRLEVESQAECEPRCALVAFPCAWRREEHAEQLRSGGV